MVGWYHQLNGHEFERVGDGQGGLACCSSWGHKESDMTGATELNCYESDILPVIFLPKTSNSHLIIRKTLGKSQLRDLIQNI